ncbi:hypothetical protein WJX75_007930 [Coccomyxa subellipsoidea]|uniref:GDT1 family protein n=1 Tax=Coccomyxa subellipsoidea TaxID=248742 RepID=A0ABR2YQ48_9CHLO
MGKQTVFKGVSWGAGVLILVAAAWALAHNAGYAPLLKEWAANSALGKSGFLAAFTLIFLSEIGDKTFFLAGLLAMKVGRAISFVGSTLALALMTVISVLIGYGFKSVPDALKSSVPIGRYLSVACMFYFGVRTLQEAWQTPKEADNEGGEFASAQLSLDEAEKGGGLKTQTAWQALLQPWASHTLLSVLLSARSLAMDLLHCWLSLGALWHLSSR